MSLGLIQFEDFELDPARFELRRRGRALKFGKVADGFALASRLGERSPGHPRRNRRETVGQGCLRRCPRARHQHGHPPRFARLSPTMMIPKSRATYRRFRAWATVSLPRQRCSKNRPPPPRWRGPDRDPLLMPPSAAMGFSRSNLAHSNPPSLEKSATRVSAYSPNRVAPQLSCCCWPCRHTGS